MLLIAERINSSRKDIERAIREKDRIFIRNEARNQALAGADYIDVNAGSFVDNEIEYLAWLIEAVQSVVETPLCLDSPNPAAIEAVIPMARKSPCINSITVDPDRAGRMLSLAVRYNTRIIGLCQGAGLYGHSADEKVNLAARLVTMATDAGVSPDNLYIDPLAYPLSTDHASALATLEAIERIMNEFPGVHTICGLTNVSYGLPERRLVNRTFLIAALTRGLDAVIMDPTDKNLYAAFKAGLMVTGRDEYCMDYITAYREGLIG
jgi:cobalamin-dependent methionine synthase I